MKSFVAFAEQIQNRIGRVNFYLTGQSSERPLIEQFGAAYGGHKFDASELGSVERTAALVRNMIS